MLSNKKQMALKEIIDQIKNMALGNKEVDFYDQGDTRKEFSEIADLAEQAESILY